jgi:hypothetical protein
MKKFIEVPVELMISVYTVAFRVEEGGDNEFVPSEFARFIETAYLVMDEETDEIQATESIIHSMN